MAEAILFTNANVNEYRQLDTKFDSTRFAAFANDVQRRNLRNLLGAALYYDFMNGDRTTGIYEKLLNGTDYTYDNNTVQFYGVIPALCYWWLALATNQGEVFHSGYGAVQFVNNQQQSFESAKSKDTVARAYIEQAEVYANDIKRYLNENSADYPLWEGERESNTSTFTTFRV